MAAQARVYANATPKAAEHFFEVMRVAEAYPLLTSLEVSAVLATECDPRRRAAQLQQLSSAHPSLQAAGCSQHSRKGAERQNTRRTDDRHLHRVDKGRVEKSRRQKGSSSNRPVSFSEGTASICCIGDSQIVRFAAGLNQSGKRRNLAMAGSLAKSGAQIHTILKLARQEEASFKNALVWVGINDLAMGNTDTSKVTQGMADLVSHLRRRCHHVYVCNLPPCPRFPAEHDIHHKIKRFNDKLAETCLRATNVTVINLHGICSTDDGRVRTSMFERYKNHNNQEDMLHLNTEGHRALLETLKREIRANHPEDNLSKLLETAKIADS